MTPAFAQTVFIGRQATEVWAALTTKSMVDQYYLAPLLALELRNGGRIAYGRDTPIIEGTVAKAEEPRLLEHTFTFTGDTRAKTVVTYEVEAVGDAMCALHVSHMVFKEGDHLTFTDITGGWPVILSSLKTLLETGKPLPWPKN